MNRSDLIARMTERLGGDRASATAAVSGVLEEIETAVARGERVTLTGFGTFDRRARAARTARNPRTGDAVQVEASVVPVFRAAAGFRSLLHDSDGAPERPEPASVTGGARGMTASTLQVLAPPPADPGVPAAVAAGDGGTRKLRKAGQAAEQDGKAAKAGKKAAKKAGKKAHKAAKGKAGKKTA